MRIVLRKATVAQDAPRQFEPTHQRIDILLHRPQRRIDQREAERITTADFHAAPTLGIQTHQTDCKAMTKRQRKRFGIAACRLEYHLHVWAIKAIARFDIGVGLEQIAGKRPLARHHVFQAVPHIPQRRFPRQSVRCAVCRIHRHIRGRMICEITADTGQVMHWLDTGCAQLRLVANTGMQQDVRRMEGAGTQHNFTTCAQDPHAVTGLQFDRHCLAVLDQHPSNQRAGHHRQILPVHDWPQVGADSRYPPPRSIVPWRKP